MLLHPFALSAIHPFIHHLAQLEVSHLSHGRPPGFEILPMILSFFAYNTFIYPLGLKARPLHYFPSHSHHPGPQHYLGLSSRPHSLTRTHKVIHSTTCYNQVCKTSPTIPTKKKNRVSHLRALTDSIHIPRLENKQQGKGT